MKKVFIFLTSGFEEIEALATTDILRRAGVDIETVSLIGQKTVRGGHGIAVEADWLFEEIDFKQTEMLILPGGTVKINEHEGLKKEILSLNAQGGKISAICAAPMVLGGLGLLKGKRATCYPGFEKYLEGAVLKTSEPVVKDGNIITGRGPGLSIDFALKIVAELCGESKSDEVAKGLLIK